MILLDTNVCIAYLHGDANVRRRLLQVFEAEDVQVPGMVVGELFYGVEKSARREDNLRNTQRFLSLIPACHADDATMRKFGELKASLERSGSRVDDADVLIAATAICRNARLATGNVRHFKRFEGLEVENWFEPK